MITPTSFLLFFEFNQATTGNSAHVGDDDATTEIIVTPLSVRPNDGQTEAKGRCFTT